MTRRGGQLRRLAAASVLVIVALSAASCGSTGSPSGTSPTTALRPTTASPATKPTAEDPGCLEAGERVVRFPSRSGARLPGVVLGTGKVGLVFGHQTDGDICQWIATARAYAGKGYRSIVFDFATYGLARDDTPRAPADDVAGAVAYFKTLGVTKVALIGGSLGAAAVVTAAPGVSLPVSAVVSLSASGRIFGTDAVAASQRLRAPLLCVASKSDSAGDYAKLAQQMCPARGPGPRQLLVVEGGAHGVDLYQDDPKVTAAVDAFLAKNAPAR